VAELAEHDVEGFVGIRQRLGVAFNELGVDGGDAGILARSLDQGRRQIEARRPGAAPRRRDGNDAGAAGHVEHALTRLHLRELHQLAGRGVVMTSTGTNDDQPSRWASLNFANGSAVVAVMLFSQAVERLL
jgi:hypothetical protein